MRSRNGSIAMRWTEDTRCYVPTPRAIFQMLVVLFGDVFMSFNQLRCAAELLPSRLVAYRIADNCCRDNISTWRSKSEGWKKRKRNIETYSPNSVTLLPKLSSMPSSSMDAKAAGICPNSKRSMILVIQCIHYWMRKNDERPEK